jgi:hypothetical protein
MQHPWRKALIFLAISMIPVYIGLYLAMKQEKVSNIQPEEPAGERSSATPNPGQGHRLTL